MQSVLIIKQQAQQALQRVHKTWQKVVVQPLWGQQAECTTIRKMIVLSSPPLMEYKFKQQI